MNWHWENETKTFELTMFEFKDYLHPVSFRLFSLNFEILLRDSGLYFEFTILNFILLEFSLCSKDDWSNL